MKAHASSNIIQFQNAAKASEKYRLVLDKALHVVFSNREDPVSPPEKPSGVTLHIVFGSDHGLAGSFNERISAFALREIPKGPEDQVIVIGQQVLMRIEDDFEISGIFPIPQSEDGITPTVQRLLSRVEELREEAGIRRALLYYNRPVEGSTFREEIETLLPLDLKKLAGKEMEWGSRNLPITLMDPDVLLSDLLRQYFFITLYRTFCFSLVAENEARIASMQSAEKNIEERLEELSFQYRMERQSQITEEISDVISGFKAIRNRKVGRKDEEREPDETERSGPVRDDIKRP
jgi:F-type H+-transporting ATPase subunit gamma